MPICAKCESKFPNRILLDGKWKNLSNRKYCLLCSPYGCHNTRRIERESKYFNSKDAVRGYKNCSICNKNKPICDFGLHQKRKDCFYLFPYCKECDSKRVIAAQRKLKELAVEYAGGKCKRCGYSKCIRCLDFHHRDYREKDFEISKFKSRNFELLKLEIDKCDLLCKNCHGEEHERLDNATLV